MFCPNRTPYQNSGLLPIDYLIGLRYNRGSEGENDTRQTKGRNDESDSRVNLWGNRNSDRWIPGNRLFGEGNRCDVLLFDTKDIGSQRIFGCLWSGLRLGKSLCCRFWGYLIQRPGGNRCQNPRGPSPGETHAPRKAKTMKTHETSQFAYAGRFSIRDLETGYLIHGGGVTAPRPRLYETAEAATEAAASITWTDCEPVELVGGDK